MAPLKHLLDPIGHFFLDLFPSLHRDGPIEAGMDNHCSCSRVSDFHPFTGMAPLKHVIRPDRRRGVGRHFHPFTGMAPLKLIILTFLTALIGIFHPFTGMAPLKQPRLNRRQAERRIFPSLHRDGPIEAVGTTWLPWMPGDHFHPFTGMAPLKHCGNLPPVRPLLRFPSLHRDGPIEATRSFPMPHRH